MNPRDGDLSLECFATLTLRATAAGSDTRPGTDVHMTGMYELWQMKFNPEARPRSHDAQNTFATAKEASRYCKTLVPMHLYRRLSSQRAITPGRTVDCCRIPATASSSNWNTRVCWTPTAPRDSIAARTGRLAERRATSLIEGPSVENSTGTKPSTRLELPMYDLLSSLISFRMHFWCAVQAESKPSRDASFHARTYLPSVALQTSLLIEMRVCWLKKGRNFWNF
jgi:hypothetical protein